jgi:hypothetical protein
MIDVEKTIISQYAHSRTICGLVRNMNTYLDPRADFNNFFDYVWNIETAQGFGLDILGRIVVIPRELEITVESKYFGFKEAGAKGFNQAPFYNGQTTTQTYSLPDNEYRKVILVKALSNISSSNSAAINQLLQNMFAGRGRCYINDLGNMRIRYVFEFALTPAEVSIMTKSGAFPRPAGVIASITQASGPIFGFSNNHKPTSYKGFGQGTFLNQGATCAIN